VAECLILDTGALIAIERKNATVAHALRAAHRKGYRVLIPSVAYTEWIRGAAQGMGKQVEALAELVGAEREIARLAGLALQQLDLDGREHLADATVAACARFYGGLLLTSDPADMRRLLATIEGRPVESLIVWYLAVPQGSWWA
jgi:predicted nucleic acid-binding protein